MSLTRLVITATIIMLGIYDLVMVATGGVEASISRYLSSFGSYPFVVFTFGYIMGHVFGWMTPTLPMGVRVQLENMLAQMNRDESYKPDGYAATLRKILGSQNSKGTQ